MRLVLVGLFLSSVPLFAQLPGMPRFDQFRATVRAPTSVAAPDFTTFPGSRRFRTRLRDGAAAGPNFAGAYRIVWWGCGTNCSSGLLVNLATGRIHDLPTAECGYAFRQDSRLLFVNPNPRRCSIRSLTEAYALTADGWAALPLPEDPQYARPSQYGDRWWR